VSCSVALRFLYWRKKIGAMPLDRGQSYSSNSPASANNTAGGTRALPVTSVANEGSILSQTNRHATIPD